jgi:hypothetical protein
VQPDVSNPRGFAESQWVVDFHARLLEAARVQTADARPSAWAATAAVAAASRTINALTGFLEEQYAIADHLVIKDPRLSWFLPLWRRCASELGIAPRVVTMLRHPAAVVESKGRHYGHWQGNVGRTAGWLNTMLFTERATRDLPRVFVRYDDLLDDWTEVLARTAGRLDLQVVHRAGAPAMRRAHQFIDPALKRSSASWGGARMPAPLREQADDVWTLLDRLADKDLSVSDEIATSLDEARQCYLDLYEDAESIAQSSAWGAAQAAAAAHVPVLHRLARRVPTRVRRRVPVQVRRRALRTTRRISGR